MSVVFFALQLNFTCYLIRTEMYNFLKNFFGLSPGDSQRNNADFQSNYHENSDDALPDRRQDKNMIFDDIDEIMGHPESQRFGFPIFNDPFEIHNLIDSFVNDMKKNMNFFGFNNPSSLIWEEDNNNFGFFNYGNHHNHLEHNGKHFNDADSLRNSYLKSPEDQNITTNKRDIDLDGKLNADDIEDILNKKNSALAVNSSNNNSQPKIFSKSVYIKTIRHPDGRIETIKKVSDHTGNEETTITHENLPPPSDYPTPGDASDISIFKKFFSF